MRATSSVFSLCIKLSRSPASGTLWLCLAWCSSPGLFSITVRRIQAGRMSSGVLLIELDQVCVDSVYPLGASPVHLCKIWFYG